VLYYGIGLWAMEFFRLMSLHHVGCVLMLIVEDNRYEMHLFVSWSHTFSSELLDES